MAKDLINWAEQVAAEYGPKIAALLGIMPKDVKFVIGAGDGDAATTTGQTIGLDPDWFAAHADDVGAVIHELVHAYQDIAGSAGTSSKAIEGMADAVRAILTPPGKQHGWTPSPEAQKFLTVAAADPTRLQTYGQEMQAGTFEQTQLNHEAKNPPTATAAGPYSTGNTPSETGGATGPGTGTTTDTPPPPPPPPTETKTPPANIRAGFAAILNAYEIPMDPTLHDLITEATQGGWNQVRFLRELRGTSQYQERFAGIFNPDGTTKMSESEYINNQKQYEAIGSQSGLNVNPGLVAWAIHNDVTPQEFQDRAAGVKMIQTNPDMYEQFKKALIQEGKAAPGDLTDRAMLKFVLGKSDKSWYDTWNLANARYAATQAGISLQKGSDRALSLNPGLIQEIANKGLSPSDLAGGFQEMAKLIHDTVPLAKIQGYGLSPSKLKDAVFGGKASTETRALIEKIHAQEAAFSEPRANAQVYADAQGNVGVIGNAQQRRAQTS